ncbi:helix-turn-helix transcriptional regulator [Nocardioides dongkuii]|uniref:helix-turn-helix transcriptional regulator n=1 Tax=Nocardioides dongkuii TaxID=2760089 RepID=UPI0018783CB2|nr:LuxR C-terminal-related transcriptional regulator [Nocardioides dongkuii]
MVTGRAVHVLADHQLMGEAVAAALNSRGRSVATMRWRFGPARAAVGPPEPGGSGPWSGVLVCDLDDPLSLAAARCLVSRGTEIWLVIAPGRVDARWGALLAAGAEGILSAGSSLEELYGALERLEAGEGILEPEVRSAAFDAWAALPEEIRQLVARLERLTASERDVLAGLRDGMPVGVLAWERGVSVATVRSQVRAVLRKLAVGTQIAAVAALARLEESELFGE